MSYYRTQEEDNIEVLIDLANDALKHLNLAKEKLQNARNWGLVDIFGGGFFMSMLKHHRLDDARDELREAQSLIRILEDKLLYLDHAEELHISVDDFTGIVDLVFDNPLTDIMVQSKIKKSMEAVDKAIVRLENILDELYAGGGAAF